VSSREGNESECTISKDPTHEMFLFAACNAGGGGLFAATSSNGGASWTPFGRTGKIATGEDGMDAAWCDPSSAWDKFGNLFLTYIGEPKPPRYTQPVVVLVSRNKGESFRQLTSFPQKVTVDQPTVVTWDDRSDPAAPGAVWVVWNMGVQQGQSGIWIDQMVARGAPVRGTGDIGPFNGLQNMPGTDDCSFGDVATAPDGAVVQACQAPVGDGERGPAKILVSTDPDGLGIRPFGDAVLAVEQTNVGALEVIPAVSATHVDAEAGLAFEKKPGPNFGWLYLVYTEQTPPGNDDLDVMIKVSRDDGATWSQPKQVNDDGPGKSQFLPRIAIDPTSGNISVCWYDCRNPDPKNDSMRVFCAVSPPTDPLQFLPNARIGDSFSTADGIDPEYGDYSGLAYGNGVAHPIWVQRFPDVVQQSAFEVMTDRVSVGGEEPVLAGAAPTSTPTRKPTPRPTPTPTPRGGGGGG
jgi:hypothetical protein